MINTINNLILIFTMWIYIFIPMVGYAQVVQPPVPSVKDSSTTKLTYYYMGSDLVDSEDTQGDMSSYLTRDIRLVKTPTGTKSVDYITKNGKDVIAESNDGKTITNEYNYTPYGQSIDYNATPQLPKSTVPQLSIYTNPFEYSSYYTDPESGLDYLNARYYSPELMTFISRDSFDLANRYAYCNGDPIDGSDPTGHFNMNDFGNLMTDIGLGTMFLMPFGGPWAGAALFAITNKYKKVNKALATTMDATQIVGGIEMMCTPGTQGLGVANIALGTASIANTWTPGSQEAHQIASYVIMAGNVTLGIYAHCSNYTMPADVIKYGNGEIKSSLDADNLEINKNKILVVRKTNTHSWLEKYIGKDENGNYMFKKYELRLTPDNERLRTVLDKNNTYSYTTKSGNQYVRYVVMRKAGFLATLKRGRYLCAIQTVDNVKYENLNENLLGTININNEKIDDAHITVAKNWQDKLNYVRFSNSNCNGYCINLIKQLNSGS